jgi:hypothetical protein
MMAKRTSIIIIWLLVAGFAASSLLCWADTGTGGHLTVADYRAELDQLLEATQQLDSSGSEIPPVLRDLPQNWQVHTEQQDFGISTEGLRWDIGAYEKDRNSTTASAIRSRIQNLRNDLDGYETPPTDVTSSRENLAAVLARPEFRGVRGPSFFDRLAQRLLAGILSLLGLLFQSSAIPTISKFLVYGLIGLAVLTLGFLVYRQIKSASEQESVIPTDLPVSVKSWVLWLADAQACAQQHKWREAIHLAYWAGISFLEHQGAWRPDRARTPREYLRLMPPSYEHREALAGLTQIFELTWYAKRRADAEVFKQTMQALERLGCHPS